MKADFRRLMDEIKEKDRARSDLLRHMISAQEAERRRVARELHDETSQTLSSISVTLQAAAIQLPDPSPARAYLKKTQELVLQALEGIDRLIRDLRPAPLEDMGLLAAVRSYAQDRFKPLGIKLHWETEGTEYELPDDVQVALFRVIHEALNNIARHSGAKAARIGIRFTENTISVVIRDDGRGFDVPAALASKESWGLQGMMERVELIGGTMRIMSSVSGGTVVSIEVPRATERGYSCITDRSIRCGAVTQY